MAEVLLTVDTSSAAGSVAVTRGETLLGEILLNVPGTHSDRLLSTASQLLADIGLKPGNLDGFGVVLGPGAFTGLRVGVATVKGLALATGKPAFGVSSLRTLALQAPAAAWPVCPLLDARKGEVYAGLFGWDKGLPFPLAPERAIAPEPLLEELSGDILFLGSGCEVYRTLIVRRLGARAHFCPWPAHRPRASSAAALVLDDLRQGRAVPPALLNPVYIRASEAEILWAARQDQTLIEG